MCVTIWVTIILKVDVFSRIMVLIFQVLLSGLLSCVTGILCLVLHLFLNVLKCIENTFKNQMKKWKTFTNDFESPYTS